jgi:hypothetical protein
MKILIDPGFEKALAVLHQLSLNKDLQDKIVATDTMHNWIMVGAYHSDVEHGITIRDRRYTVSKDKNTYYITGCPYSDTVVILRGAYYMEGISWAALGAKVRFKTPRQAARWLMKELIKDNPNAPNT